MKYQISVFRDAVQRNRYVVWTGETVEGSNNATSQEIPSDKFLDYLKGFEIKRLNFNLLSSHIIIDKEFGKVSCKFEKNGVNMEQKVDDPEILDEMIRDHIDSFARGEGVYLTIFAK